MTPEGRRAIRNVLLCIIVLGLLGLVYWAVYLLQHDALGVREIARGSLIIIGLFVLGIITENVGRVGVDIAGIKANMGSGDPPAAP